MNRAVFDCVVLLQAAGFPRGPAGGCFETIRQKRVELLLSSAVLEEIEDVLFRPKIRNKFKTLTDEAANRFLDDLFQYAKFVDPVPRVFDYPRDPKDERYINLAIAADARLLVSRDNDLLDLMNDEAFRQTCPALTILDPVSFLQTLPNDPTPTN